MCAVFCVCGILHAKYRRRDTSLYNREQQKKQELDAGLNIPMAAIPLMFEWARKIGQELAITRPNAGAVHIRYFIATDTPEVVNMAKETLGPEAVSFPAKPT